MTVLYFNCKQNYKMLLKVCFSLFIAALIPALPESIYYKKITRFMNYLKMK